MESKQGEGRNSTEQRRIEGVGKEKGKNGLNRRGGKRKKRFQKKEEGKKVIKKETLVVHDRYYKKGGKQEIAEWEKTAGFKPPDILAIQITRPG